MDLVITLDRALATPLYQQLATALRQSVLQQRLKPNHQLPPSRLLAKSLAISRATVTQSYEQLVSEGYFEARCGAGTFVCPRLPEEYLHTEGIDRSEVDSIALPRLSRFGSDLMTIDRLKSHELRSEINFGFSSSVTERFPIELWRRLLSRHCRNSAPLLNYSSDAAGYLPLRTAIADYLGRVRAVRCAPEQVIIVNGSQQALDLIARLTIDPGDWVAVENPGYLGARHCFHGQGANLQGIDIDSEGINVETLSQSRQRFKLLYVTPSHQFPTGVTLSLSRRLALLQWAQQQGTIVLEDDYDSEYRYGDRPIPALQGLDRHNTVIYVGTFSKILFPSLRIGYLVVPTTWIPVVSRAKWLCDRQAPTLEQYALTDCITEGHLERHIRRMRHLYDRRRQALTHALRYYFGDRVTILGENAGIHLMAKIDTDRSDEMAIDRAASVGVGINSARCYYLTAAKMGEFIFGYAQLDEAQIDRGVQRLSQVW
jgi:GntR family transcriptional regulator / MocR family aminotransferase